MLPPTDLHSSLGAFHPLLLLLLEPFNYMTLQLNIKVFQDYIRLVNKLLGFVFPASLLFINFPLFFLLPLTCSLRVAECVETYFMSILD